MSHTNATTNFGLPQFITTDKPAWLTDINTAFNAIDTAMKNNQTAASNAQGDATQALSDAGSAATTASAADSKGSGALASIADAFLTTDTYNVNDLVIYNNLLYRCIADVSTPGAWTGSTNWTRETLENKIDGLSGSNIPYEQNSNISIYTKLTNLETGKQDAIQETYSQTNLVPQTNVSIEDGGYCVIGNLVVVNIRFTTTGTKISGNTLIHGFPSPIAAYNNISISNSAKINMPMNTSGQLMIGDDLAPGTYIASCVYLKI